MNRGIPKKLRRRSTVTDFYVESHSVRNDRCLFPKVWDHIGSQFNREHWWTWWFSHRKPIWMGLRVGIWRFHCLKTEHFTLLYSKLLWDNCTPVWLTWQTQTLSRFHFTSKIRYSCPPFMGFKRVRLRLTVLNAYKWLPLIFYLWLKNQVQHGVPKKYFRILCS